MSKPVADYSFHCCANARCRRVTWSEATGHGSAKVQDAVLHSALRLRDLQMTKESRLLPGRMPMGRRDILWGAGGAAVAAAGALALDSNDARERDALATRLRQALSDLEITRKKEEGRKKTQLVLRAPAWTELDLN